MYVEGLIFLVHVRIDMCERSRPGSTCGPVATWVHRAERRAHDTVAVKQLPRDPYWRIASRRTTEEERLKWLRGLLAAGVSDSQ